MKTLPASAIPPRARSPLWLLLAAGCTVFLTACVQLAEVDSTDSPVYASMIGREFELKENLVARGIKLPPKFAAVDYILIMPLPGIYSRYRILDLGAVPAGSRFRIIGVVTHRSKLFPITEYVISFSGHRFGEDKPVRITSAAGAQLYLKPASPHEAPQLSERYFHVLEEIRK